MIKLNENIEKKKKKTSSKAFFLPSPMLPLYTKIQPFL